MPEDPAPIQLPVSLDQDVRKLRRFAANAPQICAAANEAREALERVKAHPAAAEALRRRCDPAALQSLISRLADPADAKPAAKTSAKSA